MQNKSITPEYGRKPGSNTIAYFPFEDDLLDHSPSPKTWTNQNISLITEGTIKSCKFPGNTANGLYITSVNAPLPMTYNFWLLFDGGGIYGPRLLDNTNSNDNWCQICVDRTTPGISIQGNTRGTITTNKRYNVCVTQASNGTVCLYINGQQTWTGTVTTSRYTGMIIGFKKSNSSDYFSGRMKYNIIENIVRNATDSLKYFNKTKRYFGTLVGA